ncbi:MAG: HAMP domain-containing histidine kinase [Betaproteobacteria bacterium]|nr:HAMP domain-containing histidine kinase [Betaproteobacteria bacterium]
MNGSAAGVQDFGISETHWKALRYFTIYRILIAILIGIAVMASPKEFPVSYRVGDRTFLPLAAAYFVETILAAVFSSHLRRHFNWQLSIQVIVDVLVFAFFIYISGAAGSGFGTMLLISIAGAGLIGQGRLVLLYPALATLALLICEVLQLVSGEPAFPFQIGLLCCGFFISSVLAQLLARWAIANEKLARRRGIRLYNQAQVSQRVIEEMQDGVLFVDRNGFVHQYNPRARTVLGFDLPAGGDAGNDRKDEAVAADPGEDLKLAACSPELAEAFAAHSHSPGSWSMSFQSSVTGMRLRARFVPTESSERDMVVFLESLEEIEAHAQQMKLAAMGRLTASIAHEIRNPLSSISYAAELLVDERREETRIRLLQIVSDNTHRLDRIVRDILELGRRDRVQPEALALEKTLPLLIDEFTSREGIPSGVIRYEAADGLILFFDRAHFYQVLWNLVSNGVRYCRNEAGSVRIVARAGNRRGEILLSIADDGEGIPDDLRQHVFEPFFTTNPRGTGLGLFIARELCDANGAHLELLENDPGARFLITGRSDAWHTPRQNPQTPTD